MLIDYTPKKQDMILDIICKVHGTDNTVHHIDTGIYEIGHFNGDSLFPDFDQYPDVENIGCYGVCDNYQQILEKCPELILNQDRKFVITITPVLRENQSPEGGWRWHKWGEYIGTYEPQHEYLYDEDIDKVYCYHIYELIK